MLNIYINKKFIFPNTNSVEFRFDIFEMKNINDISKANKNM